MDLDDWRSQIDTIDSSIIDLLNQRAGYVLKIGEIKREKGLKIKNSVRERELLERVNARNKGPLTDEAIQRIFKTILKESRNLQKSLINKKRRE